VWEEDNQEEENWIRPKKETSDTFDLIVGRLGGLNQTELLRVAEIAWALSEIKEVFRSKEWRDGGWHVPF